MESPPTVARAVDLRAVRMRPTHGASEQRLWDRLVATHHYLPFDGRFGKGLRHVATLGPTWVALGGWQAAALKLAARNRWIGWSPAQKRRRLHLVLQNSRFFVLPGWRIRNLASRVLGLSLRRLAGDMRAAHGFPVLLAETFIDPERFAGTCYRAANWRSLGRTGGYARQPSASRTESSCAACSSSSAACPTTATRGASATPCARCSRWQLPAASPAAAA